MMKKIINPKTGKKVSINGKIGKKILSNYKTSKKITRKNPKKKYPDLPEKTSAIISYNLSWATQDDKVAGSEKNFVKYCKRQASITSYNKSLSKLSYCTNNVANFLTNMVKKYNLEIIGFQEPSIDNIEIIKTIINNKSVEIYETFHSKKYNMVASIAIMYNTKLGKPINISEGDLHPGNGRPFQILFFPKVKYLIINSHWQHDLLVSEYNSKFVELQNKVKTGFKRKSLSLSTISRIIFMGDFNDHRKRLHKNKNQFTIDFLGRTLTCGDIQENGIPKTCCYNPPKIPVGNSLSTKSDYILDTETQKYFGVPHEYPINIPNSDHLPIIGLI